MSHDHNHQIHNFLVTDVLLCISHGHVRRRRPGIVREEYGTFFQKSSDHWHLFVLNSVVKKTKKKSKNLEGTHVFPLSSFVFGSKFPSDITSLNLEKFPREIWSLAISKVIKLSSISGSNLVN